ncbi:hypothetical protein ABGB12_33175 [Actinocorallia sp. B10E7]|uniref:hypothetical protein n=1 Tax=Actinocorallia sp. B10E7 TaxID=3153558 RepID=UPI00325E997E
MLLGGCAAPIEEQAADKARDEAREIMRRLHGHRVWPATAVRCFELRFSVKNDWDEEPLDADCPPGRPLTFEPWPKTPEIPDEKLDKALPHMPSGGEVDEREVREAVASLGLDPAVHVEIGSKDGVVGVLLRVKPYLSDAFDCTLARVAPGSTSVWSPPRIQRMPGEGGCFLGSALNPLRPPH